MFWLVFTLSQGCANETSSIKCCPNFSWLISWHLVMTSFPINMSSWSWRWIHLQSRMIGSMDCFWVERLFSGISRNSPTKYFTKLGPQNQLISRFLDYMTFIPISGFLRSSNILNVWSGLLTASRFLFFQILNSQITYLSYIDSLGPGFSKYKVRILEKKKKLKEEERGGRRVRKIPTDLITISEPKNTSIPVFQLLEIRRSTDFKALKLQKGRSGQCPFYHQFLSTSAAATLTGVFYAQVFL